MEYYTFSLGKITRKLPLVAIGRSFKVASFNLLGDGEMVDEIAEMMYKKLKSLKFDYFVGPEVKVVPLLQVLSRKFAQPKYVVCRKNIHGYMIQPIKSSLKNGLILDGRDAELINGKKVVVVDDVVTSGNTLSIIEDLMTKAKADLVCHAAIFKQGEIPLKTNTKIVFLGKLPVFSS